MCAFYSECGDEFDEYVRRIVGPMGVKERSISNLWAGRRFKLHFDGEWRDGKVIEWCQWKVNPGLHLTEWRVTFEFDTLKQHDTEESKAVASADQNHIESGKASEVKTMKDSPPILRVNRMNIKGGGTLRHETNDSELFSLEWIDSASPSVNLEDGKLRYKCPCCRANEPIIASHEKPNFSKTDECPVCLEIVGCRVLGCGHGICHPCWNSYLQATITFGVQLGHLDSDKIQKERTRRDELFREKLSSGKAKTVNCFAKLVEQVPSGEKGLAQLWKELMVESVATFFYSDVKTVITQLSTDAIKIFLQVLEDRKDELFVMLNGTYRHEMSEFVSSISFYCCDVISEKYRQAGNIHCALPWSELALFHAKQARSRTLLAAAYVFLGSAQPSAGLLIEASRTYDNSLGLGSAAGDVWKYREELLREIEQWTGSSGKLTPGC